MISCSWQLCGNSNFYSLVTYKVSKMFYASLTQDLCIPVTKVMLGKLLNIECISNIISYSKIYLHFLLWTGEISPKKRREKSPFVRLLRTAGENRGCTQKVYIF